MILLLLLLLLGKSTHAQVKHQTIIKDPMILKTDSSYWIGNETDDFIIVSKNGYFGLADQDKHLVTEVIYDRIFNFNEGMVVVCKDNFYGALDSTGKEVLPPSMRFLADFHNGFAYGHTFSGEDVLINKKGQNIVPGKNIRILPINGNYVKIDQGVCCLLNKKGTSIYCVNTWAFGDKEEKFWKERSCELFNEPVQNKLSEKQEANSSGIFHRRPELSSDFPFVFSEGLAMVPQLINNQIKCGFIDETGKSILPFEYDNARAFVNGYACAKLNNLWGIIDKKGTWVIQPRYQNLENANGNYFIVTENALQGVIDLNGSIKIPLNFLKVDFLFDNLFAVLENNERTRKNAIEYRNGFDPTPGIAFWGCISVQTGDTILPFKFNEVLPLGKHLGAGLYYQFVEHQTEESNRAAQLALSQAPRVNYSGKASETIFTDSGKKGTYELPDIWIDHVSFFPDFQHIKQFLLCRIVADYLYIGGVFLDENANEVKDQNKVDDLLCKLNNGKPIMNWNTKTHLFGAALPNGKSVLSTDFEQLHVVKTGIIAKKNGKYGFYDFKGTQIIPHLYTNMTELRTGIIHAFRGEDDHQGLFLNKANKELKIN